MSAPDKGPKTTGFPALKYRPTAIDSLDARIIQFKYALVKLKAVMDACDSMLERFSAGSASEPQFLIFVQYICFLTTLLFAINETGYSAKLQALEGFKVPKHSSVSVSPVVTHVPYDIKDQPVVPLSELPSVKSSIACLKVFKTLCLSCQEGYRKRLTNALREIQNDAYLEDLDVLFKTSFFDLEKEIDTSLKSATLPTPSFVLRIDPDKQGNEDFLEACLIDMDLYALFTLTSQMSATLDVHRSLIGKFREARLAPKHLQDSQLKDIPHSVYSLHRILFWALRLNDVYTIVRKFGRQIYLSNYHHLHDQKFLTQAQNGGFFRSLVLKDMDDSFNTTKKNGVLIATITRFVRMNSKHEVNTKNTLEFVGFIQQSFTYVETLTKKLREFGLLWISAELAFRQSYDLPTEHLSVLNDALQDELAKEAKAKREKAVALQKEQRAKEKSKLQPPPKTAPVRQATPDKPKPTPVTPTKQPLTTRGSRSSSIGSIDSATDSDAAKGVTRRTSVPSLRPRPQSMVFTHRNTSSSSLQASSSPVASPIDKAKAVTTTVEGRPRSSSQPLSFNAAAAALKGASNSNPNDILRSPTGSLRRTESLTKKPLAASIMTSPFSNKTAMLNVVEESGEDSVSKEVKLTANQKFQQHLRDAQKSGALFGKQKEVLTNVVFDPNNPSGTKIRRSPKPVESVSPPEPPVVPAKDIKSVPPTDKPKHLASETPKHVASETPQKPTRAQITKLNTQRNSVLMDVKEDTPRTRGESVSSDSQQVSELSKVSTDDDDSSLKKVRFAGVPAYTPAEDAPTSHSSRILKNFVPFKMPLMQKRSHTALWQKDQMLKKEESLLFKQHVHPGQEKAAATLTASYAPNPPSLKLSRFKHKF